MAHELAQPIQSITGMLDTVMRMASDLPDDVVALMERANAGALRLQEIVDAMLELAHDDRELRPRPTELTERLDRVRSALTAQIHRSGATVQAGDLLPRVTADPIAIEVVLQNLVSNTLVHGGRGVTVTVGGRETADGWSTWVDDDGPGIPEAERDAVLAPGQQGSSAGPGHGLGLATSRRLVERHGGTIALTVAPTGGSRALVTLPRPPA